MDFRLLPTAVDSLEHSLQNIWPQLRQCWRFLTVKLKDFLAAQTVIHFRIIHHHLQPCNLAISTWSDGRKTWIIFLIINKKCVILLWFNTRRLWFSRPSSCKADCEPSRRRSNTATSFSHCLQQFCSSVFPSSTKVTRVSSSDWDTKFNYQIRHYQIKQKFFKIPSRSSCQVHLSLASTSSAAFCCINQAVFNNSFIRWLNLDHPPIVRWADSYLFEVLPIRFPVVANGCDAQSFVLLPALEVSYSSPTRLRVLLPHLSIVVHDQPVRLFPKIGDR